MRLIDADELKKDDEVIQWLSLNAVRTGKTLKMFSELFIKKIDKQLTIQALPLSVLQEIREEIEREKRIGYQRNHKTYDKCLKIIDKHIKEIEDIGDYPDTIPNQFDNMTGSMNL